MDKEIKEIVVGKLKASYTQELADQLKELHGLDVEAEILSILKREHEKYTGG